jgi:hypothetical protein
VWCRLIGILCQSAANRLRAWRVGDHLQQAARVNKQPSATVCAARRRRRARGRGSGRIAVDASAPTTLPWWVGWRGAPLLCAAGRAR